MLQTASSVRQHLTAERDRLAADISRLKGVHHTDGTASNHPAETGSTVSEDATNVALVEIRSRRLARVEEALRRLEAGTYGVCESCGEEIDPARLEALPQATRCVACQQQRETVSTWVTLR
jgi:DnaK suppressor protein